MKFSFSILAALAAQTIMATPAPIRVSVVNGVVSASGIPSNTGTSNFCLRSGQALADGTQNRGGSCSSTPQGSIPATNKMVSTLILEPKNGAVLRANTPIGIKVRTSNMDLGFFDEPNTQYYANPQTLNSQGLIEGHQHVVIQRINDPQTPMNAEVFEFFKGLDSQPDANNDLTTTLDEGLPAGTYRLCSLTGTRSHQPVIMPVAKRGAQDDCIRFSVANNRCRVIPLAA